MYSQEESHMDIKALSPNMFWDTPIEHIDPLKHSGWIVERVMNYGQLKDWRIIQRWYGKKGLSSIVTELRALDAVSVSFLCVVLKLNPEDFRCYVERQSKPNLWTS